MKKTAVIFPGQGAQSVGMGRAVADQSLNARRIFEQANDIVGFDLTSICFDGPADELEKTDIQQPAIFTTSVAIWASFLEAGATLEHFAAAGGLSLGEYTALHLAGAMSFEDGVRLVQRRGRLMQSAAEAEASGMVSLVGADEATATKLCEAARQDDILVPANFNCPGQVVISGHLGACKRAQEIATQFECRAVALPVAGAFHSPLMKPAADALNAVLEATSISEPVIPVVANVDAAYHGDGGSIRASLHRQVDHPVRWQHCVMRLLNDGIERFVEIGPGRVLTGLMRKIDRKVEVVNVSSVESIVDALPVLAG